MLANSGHLSLTPTAKTMTPLEITAQHVTWLEPEDCYYSYRNNSYPGWIVGQIVLPIVPAHSSIFLLVRDGSGEPHWLPSKKVSRRGQSYLFDTYGGNTFNWQKIHTFAPLV